MSQYDGIAERFSSLERENHPLWNKMYALAGRMVERRSPAGYSATTIVADLGCGSGRFGRELINNGRADVVVGFDNSEEMLRIGISNMIPGLSFAKQDVFEGFPEQWCRGLFDFVTAYNVVQCADSEDQLRTFFQNVQRLLNVTVGELEHTVQFVTVLINPEHPISESLISGVQSTSKWVDRGMVDGSKIHTTLRGMNGSEICSFQNHYWREETVERIAKSAGLGNLCWYCPLEFRGTSLVIFSGGRVS